MRQAYLLTRGYFLELAGSCRNWWYDRYHWPPWRYPKSSSQAMRPAGKSLFGIRCSQDLSGNFTPSAPAA